MNIVVLVAMVEEARSILADSRFGWEPEGKDRYRSTLPALSLTLVLTGIGKVNAAWSLARALEMHTDEKLLPARPQGRNQESPQPAGRLTLESEDRAPEGVQPKRIEPVPGSGAGAGAPATTATATVAVSGSGAGTGATRVTATGIACGDGILVISLGTSGALDRTPVGTMVLCGEFVEHDMDVTAIGYPAGVTFQAASRDPVFRTADAAILADVASRLADAGIRTLPGRTLSGDQFMTDPAIAAAKRARFGGEGAVVVDMECAAIAKLRATKARGPYLALRYVSDNADHDARFSWVREVDKAAAGFDQALVALATLAGVEG